MKIRLLILIVSFLGLGVQAQAQQKVSPNLQSANTDYDFGIIVEGGSTYADFSVLNTGKEEVYLLNAKFQEDCKVRYSTNEIQPGQTAIIRVKFNPEKKGVFERKISVFTGDAPTPFTLTIRGKVNYIDETADPACPDFSQIASAKGIKEDFTIQVIDLVSEQPVANAGIVFDPNPFVIGKLYTAGDGAWNGRVSIGLYRINVSARGYYDTLQELYIGKGVTSTLVMLRPMPVDTTKILADNNEKKEKKETFHLPDLNILKERKHKVDSTHKDDLPKEKPGELPTAMYGPNNIVFLIDVSTSMNTPTKMPLLKIAMKKLLYSLRSIDRVSIVTYASGTKVVLEPTTADHKKEIAAQIDALIPFGQTLGSKGIHQAYAVAESNFIKNGNNMIFLATDGGFNLDKSDDALFSFISQESKEGFVLSVAAFGKDKRAIEKMKKIADKGNGSYVHIADEAEANALLVDEIKLRSLRKK